MGGHVLQRPGDVVSLRRPRVTVVSEPYLRRIWVGRHCGRSQYGYSGRCEVTQEEAQVISKRYVLVTNDHHHIVPSSTSAAMYDDVWCVSPVHAGKQILVSFKKSSTAPQTHVVQDCCCALMRSSSSLYKER